MISRPESLPRLRAVLALAALLASCGGGEATDAPAPQDRDDTIVDAEPGIPAQLSALGYVEFADVDEEGADGVVLYDAAQSHPGVSLYVSMPNEKAVLIDMSGRTLKEWTAGTGPDGKWRRAELMANGDLLCIIAGDDANHLTRYTWDGRVLWTREMDVHHDIEELPDGRLLVLTRKARRLPGIDETRDTWDNELVFLSAAGEDLSAHSLFKVLRSDKSVYRLRRPTDLDQLAADELVDLIHANTVFWIDDAALAGTDPIYARGNVLVTFRHQDLVAIFDRELETILWAWGAGQLQGPHEGAVLANGNVLLLDNGWQERGYSRLVEVDPRTDEIVWEYVADPPADFHTLGRGSLQRLPNGNLFVGDSNNGAAFEITRAGEVVWRFNNPNRDVEGRRAVLRIDRYDAEWVDSLLAEEQR